MRFLLLLLCWTVLLPGVAAAQTDRDVAADAPYSLARCIQLAQARNVQAQRADLNTATSRSTLRQARANRYPTLNGSAGYTYSSGRSIDPGTNQFVDQAVGSVTPSLSSSVTLFNGGQIQNTIRQNSKALAATELDAEATRRDLALQVTQAYVAILQAQEQLQTARAQQAETEAQLKRTRQLLAAGSVPENNVLQVQAQLAGDQLSVTNAENTLASNRLTLLQLLEEPARANFTIEQPQLPEPEETSAEAPNAEQLFGTALQTQPQVRANALRSEGAVLGLRAARGQLLPRLALSGNLSTTYSSARRLYSYQTVERQQVVGYLNNDPTQPVLSSVPITTTTAGSYSLNNQFRDNFNPSIGLTLSIPILNNLQTRRTVERAAIAVASATLDERDTRNQLRKDVEQAQNDLLAARRRYASARDQLRYQEQAYRNLEVKYRFGVATAQDLLVEKNKFASAQSELTQARYEYVLRDKVVAFYQGKPLTF